MPRFIVWPFAILAAVVLVASTDAAGERKLLKKQCRQQCASAIAACVESALGAGSRSPGAVRRRCKKQTLRQCKGEGLEVCTVSATSSTTLPGGTTTTTLPGPGACAPYPPADPCTVTADALFEASTGGCCIVDACRGRVYASDDPATQIPRFKRGKDYGDGDTEEYVAYGCGSVGLQFGSGFRMPQPPPEVLADGSQVFRLEPEDIGWGPIAITVIPNDDDPFWALLDAKIVLNRACAPLEQVLASAVVTFERDDGTTCEVRSYMSTRRHQ